MTRLWDRLKERKLVQWAAAYLAGAWLLLQVIDVVGDNFDWPTGVFRAATVFLGVGFPAVLVCAWFHGEKGNQRVTAAELAILAGLCVAAGVGIALVGRSATGTSAEAVLAGPQAVKTADAVERNSIAVLPFADVSPNRDHEYLGDGVADEILGALTQVPGLRVAARTSSFSFKGQQVPVDEVGRRLRVAAVLEGTVRGVGDRLRITAQLVDAKEGYRLWSQTYERRPEDLFAVQEEIARAIVGALRPRLAGETRQAPPVVRIRPTESMEAYTLYLQGRQAAERFGTKGRAADQDEALRFYREALALDPRYARAHAGIAGVWVYAGNSGRARPVEAYARAREAAQRALALDSSLGEAHAALGSVLLFHDWDFAGAEQELRRALQLDPRDVSARFSLWILLCVTGRFAECAAEESTLWKDVFPEMTDAALLATAFARRFDDAVRAGQAWTAAAPDWANAHFVLAYALAMADRHREALEAWRRSDSLMADPSAGGLTMAWQSPSSVRVMILAGMGREADARREIARMEAVYRSGGAPDVSPTTLAMAYSALGEVDRAFEWLERAYAERSPGLVYLKHEPAYDRIRRDPRFPAMVRRVGLP